MEHVDHIAKIFAFLEFDAQMTMVEIKNAGKMLNLASLRDENWIHNTLFKLSVGHSC